METFDEIERLFTEAVQEAGERARMAGSGSVADAKGKVYDIAVLEDGKMYVYASGNVITGTGVDNWRKQITKFFKDLLDNKASLDIPTQEGDVLTLTMDQTEYKARDKYKQVDGNRVQLTEEEFLVKLHAEAHIDELAEISREGKQGTVADSKNHDFSKDGFTYRTAYFRDFDGKYYRLTISVGHNGAVSTVYNVGQMKTDMLPSGKIVSTFKGSKANSVSNAIITESEQKINTSGD